MKNINPTQTSAWQALQKHFEEMKDVTIADLFAKDSDRFTKFSATFDDLMLVDFSKNRITEETLAKLREKTWGVTYHEGRNGKFLVLPSGVKGENNWTVEKKNAVRLVRE